MQCENFQSTLDTSIATKYYFEEQKAIKFIFPLQYIIKHVKILFFMHINHNSILQFDNECPLLFLYPYYGEFVNFNFKMWRIH